MSVRAGASTGKVQIARAFERARAAGRGALVPYLCAGDPDRATSAALLEACRGPADVIELGIPYGDPLADGPTVAAAAQRALAAGTTLDAALELAGEALDAGSPPIVLFTYFNPVVQYGIERFARELARAGISGAIVPDIPLEETHALAAAFAPHGLVLPLLVAPTTPPERAAAIARASDGFIYLVSRLGVTGARREPDFTWLAERVRALRGVTALPLAVGFGISTPEHVRRTCAFADGAIVGSALIDTYAGTSGSVASERVRTYLQSLSEATPCGV